MTDQSAQDENKALQKLLTQQAKIKEKIKQEQKKQEQKKKGNYDRKCQLIGSAILEEIKTNTELSGQVQTILGIHIKTKNDRQLLGLPELQKEEDRTTQTQPEISIETKTENEDKSKNGFWKSR